MAASGAKVLQLRSVEFARNHGVRLHVRSSFSDEDGTWVSEEDERMLEKAIISGVTHTVEEAIYRVDGAKASQLFYALADAGASVDTIIQTGPEIVFSAPFSDTDEVTKTLDSLGVRWSSRDDLGKVSLVGAGMRTHPGIAGRTFSTLAEVGIEPEIVNTSPIKIACFLPRDDVERAVKALHEAFELDTEEAERAHE
jgi:aspartate kinase